MITAFGMSCYLNAPKAKDAIVHVYMLDIGQGDSFLIEAANGKKILIDGGRDSTVLSELTKVLPAGDKSIDVMIATHPDADHIGGLQTVLERYHVGLFLTSQVTTDTKTFTDLYTELYKEHIPSYYVRHDMVLTLDANTTFTILFPDRDTSGWKTNEASVVGKLQVGNRSMLFTGDSPSSIEHFLVQAYHGQLASDVLKLGHHGSKYSSSAEYLEAVSPELGLVSAGIDNSYHHPNVEMLDRMKALAIPWISTQDKGTVDLSTDGIAEWSWKSVD
ncbi:MAG: internalization-like protein competence protein ComEC/Rec2, competence protein ComEC protein [Candidatus Nomurabacteria bacterium]|nr:internalization-like protein competence protein ComEC/Rec2, competence protein ComEC protein [Candidatus Nomurabacteria bacterium]